MLTSIVSDKGQVVIPAAFRHALGIKAGTALDFFMLGNGLNVSLRHEVPRSAIEQGYGMLRAHATKSSRSKGRKLSDVDVAQLMKNQAKNDRT